MSYVVVDEYSSDDEEIVDESEVNMVKLKPGPPYTFKLLKPSNGKSPIETEKTDKYVAKKITLSMCLNVTRYVIC